MILKFLYISILLAEERKKTSKPQNQTKLLVLKTRLIILRTSIEDRNRKGKKTTVAKLLLKNLIIISISWLLSI